MNNCDFKVANDVPSPSQEQQKISVKWHKNSLLKESYLYVTKYCAPL
jgi:hypothetical protein